MVTKGVSHIAIGVRDMDKSLRFYRDLLGFQVVRDEIQKTRGTVLPALYKDPHEERRAVTLYWKRGKEEAFIVLSEHTDKPVSGEAIKLDQIGVHHFAFWVDDLQETYEKVKAAAAPIVLPPTVFDTVAYGEPPGGKVMTTLFRDPDGTVIQLDQRV